MNESLSQAYQPFEVIEPLDLSSLFHFPSVQNSWKVLDTHQLTPCLPVTQFCILVSAPPVLELLLFRLKWLFTY